MRINEIIPKAPMLINPHETCTRRLRRIVREGFVSPVEALELFAKNDGWFEEYKELWLKPVNELPEEFFWSHYDMVLKSREEEMEQKRQTRAVSHRWLRLGIISKEPCKVCGNENSQMHHIPRGEDRSYHPERIIWLCRLHHGEMHRVLNERYPRKQPAPLSSGEWFELFRAVFGDEPKCGETF
jgi:hypothetical protein